MFCLFPTNKSDCNLRITDPLWLYIKNTEHLEPLLVTPNKRCFCITQNSVRIQKPKPNGWKTQSDFVKRKMVLEIYMYKNKCVKLRMFWVYQYQHI